MRADEGPGRALAEPFGDAAPEVGEGDPGAVAAGSEAARMVCEGEDRQAVCEDRRPRLLEVSSGSRPGDSGRAQVLERVEQGVDPVVERVVVGERDAVDAEVDERLDGCGW